MIDTWRCNMLNSFGVSAQRVAAVMGLVTALGAVPALSEGAQLSLSERKEAAYHSIFHDRIVRGDVILTGSTAPLSETGLTGVAITEAETALPCFAEDVIPMLTDGVVRDATLMLMAVYNTDEKHTSLAYYGTGTVIRADTGINRVLTAAHVANPQITTKEGNPATLLAVYAFDGEGRLVTVMEPALHNSSRMRAGEVTHDLVHEDVMVLAPQSFPSEEMARSWQGRGVEVAPVQSETVLLFHGQGGNSFIASGYSGAALLDPQGRAVGLVTEIVPALNSYRPAPNTVMPEATMNAERGVPTPMPPGVRALLEEVAAGPSVGVTVDAVAGGPPLSSPRVLSALGIDPNRIRLAPSLETDLLFSAGFPGRECRTSWLTYVPRLEIPFLDRTGGHILSPDRDPVVYTDVPGALLVLGQDGEIAPAPKGDGFGMADFLSAIDAMSRSKPMKPWVNNPFGVPGTGNTTDLEDPS